MLTDQSLDSKKIGYLIREEDRADIEAFINQNPLVVLDFIPVAIIGEGTDAHNLYFRLP